MSRRAFTLVETLVTVSVIAALLAVLLPGLRAASGAARTTACTSNLRQIATACEAYVASNGAMPAAVLYLRDAGTVRTVAWDFEQRAGVAARAGWGAVLGRAVAAAVKMALGVVMGVVGLFAVWG